MGQISGGYAMRLGLAVAACGLMILAGCGGGSSVPAGDSTTAPILPPVANAGGPYTGTAGTAVTFSGAKSSDPQGQTLTYSWSFGDGTTGTGVSPTHTYGQVAGVTSTTYTVGLTVQNTSGYSGQATTTATIASATALSDVAITGVVQTGAKAIVGAHVYLLAANTTGYGAASVSLLTAAETGYSDTVGAYVPTSGSGAFSLTGDYTCTSGQQLYLYTSGGNAGAGANSAATMLAAIGPCPQSGANAITAHVNELTTVAAAYALAGFATDALHVSSSGTTLALTGIANAFANAGNLVSLTTGAALATTPAGNGAVPQSEINTLGNILSACVDLSNASNSCSLLFSNAYSGGMSGTAPTDTATAAIYIAHNPEPNVTSLYQIPVVSPPYTPALGASPHDFTIAIAYSGSGLSVPEGIAVDAAGNAWVANYTGNSVTKLTSLGAAATGSPFTGGNINQPFGVAIDGSGNAWVANYGNSSVTEIAGSSATQFTVGGLNHPRGIAIDGSGNVWVANSGGNSVTKLTSAGAAAAGSPFTGGGLSTPYGIAVDGAGDAWIANYGGASVTQLTSAGAVVTGSPYTFAQMLNPAGIAVDGAGYVWVTDFGGSSVTKLSHAGANLSGTGGYTLSGQSAPFAIALDGSTNAWVADQSPAGLSELSSSGTLASGADGYTSSSFNSPTGVAVDGSGDVWIANNGSSTVSEVVGAATPVKTPIVAGLPSTPTSGGTSSLATEP